MTPSPLSATDLTSWVASPRCGAVVTFCGTVRNTSGERNDVLALEYETDVQLAESAIAEVVASARQQWPAIGAVAIHHRVGKVELGESAVIVAVSSAHRGEAFDAAEFCIDTLKACVPMWKRDVWPGGGAWSSDARSIKSVGEARSVQLEQRDDANDETS